MPENSSDQAHKKRKGGNSWQKARAHTPRSSIERGDWGVFVTCERGRETKCAAEIVDLFNQNVGQPEKGGDEAESDEDEDDIETQIKKEIEGLKPNTQKSSLFEVVKFDLPCIIFVKFDKSIDPEKLVHQMCLDAHANPDQKRSRYVQRLTPARSIRKTLSVDLEEFAREILKPHFHSGGPPKKYAIRPSLRGNKKFGRDAIIKTVADLVGPEHPVDLKNYDLVILVDVVQNIMSMSVVGSDYDKLRRFSLAELYSPGSAPQEA
ncbi:THUMP domain-containing protein [Aspergillus undulatus]|uniref:THUMP domain-containing protein n=1 Tax=Aspergillus undulatus TaxID=1810928 RepID=UPI003CCD5939